MLNLSMTARIEPVFRAVRVLFVLDCGKTAIKTQGVPTSRMLTDLTDRGKGGAMHTGSAERIRRLLYVSLALMALVALFFLSGCKAEAPGSEPGAGTAPGSTADSGTRASVPTPDEQEPGAKPARLTPEAGLFWNVWIESDGWVQKNIPPDTTAAILLDLSKYIYAPESAIRPGPHFRQHVEDEAQRRPETSIIVRASLLGAGDRVVFGFETPTQQRVWLDLTKLTNTDDKAFAADQHHLSITDAGHLQPELSKKYRLGQYRIPVTVKSGAPECFQIAYTIWDGQDARPLDHVVFTAATAGGDKSASCGVPRLQGGFGAMAGALSSAGTTKTAASLYVFEYKNTLGAIQTRAVFVDLQSGATSAFSPEMYSWSIPGSLTGYLNGQDFEEGIRDARKNETGKYARVAAELKRKFFPFDKFDGKHSSGKAFEKLADLPAPAGETPIVLTRYVSAQGKHVYVPLGILNASPMVKRKFQVFYPLPREDYGTRQCIGEYTFAYPKKLSALESTLDLDGVDTVLPKDRFRRLENEQQLRCYLNLEGDACKQDTPAIAPQPGEAFVLLAHQSNGLLWYTDDSVLDRIVIDDQRRTFAPGSVAFLSACSTLNSGENADRLVTRLNEYGVDAIVASPFPVDPGYGVLLSKNLALVLAEAYANKEMLSVHQIFRRAVEKINAEPISRNLYGEMDFEFLVLGNSQIKLCR